MATVLVRTADFRLAYHVIKALRDRGVEPDQIGIGTPLPTPDAVWMSSPEEAATHPGGRPIPVTLDTLDAAVEQAIRRSQGFDRVRHLTFGIDPGPRPGLAWLADGVLGGEAQHEDIEGTVSEIQRVAASIAHDALLVRIGDGSPTIGRRIANVCLARGLRVEFVDERRTSRGIRRHDHQRAAVRIAALAGAAVEGRQRVEASAGEVRELQRRSRRASEGRVTIPEELAQAVAVGRLTIDEALDEQERRAAMAREPVKQASGGRRRGPRRAPSRGGRSPEAVEGDEADDDDGGAAEQAS